MKDHLKHFHEEQYAEYLQDIEIANKAMEEALLNIPDSDVLYDIYAIPSHNHQAFYAKVYAQDDKYNVLYAKPIFQRVTYDEDIFMYPFRDVVEAQKSINGVLDGRIVCGIKTIEKDFARKLSVSFGFLPKKHILDEQNFILDGVFHAIRVFENGTVQKEVVYHDENDIPFVMNGDETELKWFYGSLYFMIEQIIGRGDDGSCFKCDCNKYGIGSSTKDWKPYWSFYKEAYMSRLYKCVYCDTLWTRYMIGDGWNACYKEADDEKTLECVALNKNDQLAEWNVAISRDKLKFLEENVVKFLQKLPDYKTEELQLVEEYFTKVNNSDYVESVGIEEDGTYILYFRVKGVLKDFKRKNSLEDATVRIVNTIKRLKCRGEK